MIIYRAGARLTMPLLLICTNPKKGPDNCRGLFGIAVITRTLRLGRYYGLRRPRLMSNNFL